MPKTPTDNYTALRMAIGRELAALETTVKRAVIMRYWNIGKILTDTIGPGRFRQKQTGVLMKQLTADFGRKSESEFYKMANFYQTYTKQPPVYPLSWTHYKALLTVDDAAERCALADKAVAENISCDEFVRMVRLTRDKDNGRVAATGAKLSLERGRLHYYLMRIDKKYFKKSHTGFVDLGFGIEYEHACRYDEPARTQYIVHSQKNRNGYTLLYSNRDGKYRYTYKAIVLRVIDADTVLVRIDLGFYMSVRTKIRLRGIDAPEMYSTAGRTATVFVKERLAPLDCIVVRTYTTEKYGRYLGDVFYSPTEKDPSRVARFGTFLNQELLDTGHARVWEG